MLISFYACQMQTWFFFSRKYRWRPSSNRSVLSCSRRKKRSSGEFQKNIYQLKALQNSKLYSNGKFDILTSWHKIKFGELIPTSILVILWSLLKVWPFPTLCQFQNVSPWKAFYMTMSLICIKMSLWGKYRYRGKMHHAEMAYCSILLCEILSSNSLLAQYHNAPL